MTEKYENITFEEALSKLEKLTEKLESGDLGLEESIAVFQDGVTLTLYCQKALDQAEGTIKELIKNVQGTWMLNDWKE